MSFLSFLNVFKYFNPKTQNYSEGENPIPRVEGLDNLTDPNAIYARSIYVPQLYYFKNKTKNTSKKQSPLPSTEGLNNLTDSDATYVRNETLSQLPDSTRTNDSPIQPLASGSNDLPAQMHPVIRQDSNSSSITSSSTSSFTSSSSTQTNVTQNPRPPEYETLFTDRSDTVSDPYLPDVDTLPLLPNNTFADGDLAQETEFSGKIVVLYSE